jgi:CRISPR/Cas system-associated exonuclease Cas4 (RecB family)
MKPASFSVVIGYEKCPYTRRLHLEGVPQLVDEDPNSPLARGDRTHAEAEAYLKKGGPMPDWRYHRAELTHLINAKDLLEVEQNWYFNERWEPVGRYKEAWVVMKLDVVIPAWGTLIDWKTGKPNEIKHMFQAQLYAVGADALYPGRESWLTQFFYLDIGKEKSCTLHADQIVKARAKWTHRIGLMMANNKLLPRPSVSACKWCNYRHVCEYSVATNP